MEVINDEKVVVEYIYDTKSNTIEHTVFVKGDTIVKEVIKEVEVEKIVVTENKWPSPWWLILILLIPILWKWFKKLVIKFYAWF